MQCLINCILESINWYFGKHRRSIEIRSAIDNLATRTSVTQGCHECDISSGYMFAVFAKVKHSSWTEIHLNFEILTCIMSHPDYSVSSNLLEKRINKKRIYFLDQLGWCCECERCSTFTLLCVQSSFAIILMGKRRVCLQFVIVVFPDHTHLVFLMIHFHHFLKDISDNLFD